VDFFIRGDDWAGVFVRRADLAAGIRRHIASALNASNL
jgi:hypothetical protein